MIIKSNLGGLMKGCKNVNPFRDLTTTKLENLNFTCSDLNNPLVERIVLASRPLSTIRRMILVENWEIEGETLCNLFRLKKIKV